MDPTLGEREPPLPSSSDPQLPSAIPEHAVGDDGGGGGSSNIGGGGVIGGDRITSLNLASAPSAAASRTHSNGLARS